MDDEDNTITVNTMAFSGNLTTGASNYWSTPAAAYGIANGGTGVTASNFTYNSASTIAYQNAAGALTVNGDADFKGDVKIDGRSVRDSLAAIEKRLSILTPDPKKLAKYEALQKAYKHYKTLEAMCFENDDA